VEIPYQWGASREWRERFNPKIFWREDFFKRRSSDSPIFSSKKEKKVFLRGSAALGGTAARRSGGWFRSEIFAKIGSSVVV